jgi:hypothetical protein
VDQQEQERASTAKDDIELILLHPGHLLRQKTELVKRISDVVSGGADGVILVAGICRDHRASNVG